VFFCNSCFCTFCSLFHFHFAVNLIVIFIVVLFLITIVHSRRWPAMIRSGSLPLFEFVYALFSFIWLINSLSFSLSLSLSNQNVADDRCCRFVIAKPRPTDSCANIRHFSSRRYRRTSELVSVSGKCISPADWRRRTL